MINPLAKYQKKKLCNRMMAKKKYKISNYNFSKTKYYKYLLNEKTL